MKREHVNEIRQILEGIREGKLKHNQEHYHSDCRTAHCVAGWKQFLDAQKLNIELKYIEQYDHSCTSEETDDILRYNNIEISPWYHAAKSWGLNYIQAQRLFDCFATLDQQFDLLKELEEEIDD